MAKRFPPRADGPAVRCLQHFADGVAALPSVYGLCQPDIDTIRQAVGEFADAFRVSSNKATRSTADVILKDQKRWCAEKLCQGYANRIQANHGISDLAKIEIGVNPQNNSRSKIYVQQSSPIVTILAAANGSHVLRYADSTTPNRAARPYGALFLQLFVAIGDAPTTDPKAAKFLRGFSRNLMHVSHESKHRGMTATYFGRWSGKRPGDEGPWSMPVHMTIAA